MTVAVSGKQHAGGMFEASQTVSVEPYITHIVKLEVRDIYVLHVFHFLEECIKREVPISLLSER